MAGIIDNDIDAPIEVGVDHMTEEITVAGVTDHDLRSFARRLQSIRKNVDPYDASLGEKFLPHPERGSLPDSDLEEVDRFATPRHEKALINAGVTVGRTPIANSGSLVASEFISQLGEIGHFLIQHGRLW